MSDDEEQYDPKAHKQLLDVISSLGNVQHIRKSTRNELQPEQDEFRLIKSKQVSSSSAAAKAVGVNDLVQILRNSGKHIEAGKKLKNVHSTKKVLEKPLEKPAADRIKRTIFYENAKKNLGRWDAVVAKNRSAETHIFPIPSETIYVNTSAHVAQIKKNIKSDLAKELEASDLKLRALRKAQIGDTTDDKEVAAKENEMLNKQLTREELNARRRELAYLKMRESQKSAKARMQNKIKSKKFHKHLKRQKMLEQLKEFELLQKTNPEAALEKLNALEKSRVLERASLRHKNTGTWAKNLQVRAKYDKDVRKDLAEQLAVSRQLTSKKETEESDSDNEEKMVVGENKRNEVDNGFMDAFNPWTKGKSNAAPAQTTVEGKDDPNWRKYWTTRNENEKLLAEHREQMEAAQAEKEEEAVKPKKTKKTKAPEKKQLKKKKPQVTIENGWQVEEVNEKTIDDIFNDHEDDVRKKVASKLEKLKQQAERLKPLTRKEKKAKKQKDELKNLKDLMFNNQRQRPDIDEELQHEEVTDQPAKTLDNAVSEVVAAIAPPIVTTPNAPDTIDPNKVTTLKLTQNSMRSSQTMNDALGVDEDEADLADDQDSAAAARQLTISEAFEDDDIIADFNKDKTQDSEAKNTELQLAMPGWGSWAGAGISEEVANRRNKRLLLKLAEKEKRRDDNKDHLYINENGSKQTRTHLVSNIPFPFKSLADYEASIRAPIGRNFVPETAFRMLTRPEVITRKGQVIEPMDESELIKKDRHLRHVVDRRIQRMEQSKVIPKKIRKKL